MRGHEQNAAWRYGTIRGLAVSLLMLASLALPGLSEGGYGWSLGMGSGIAALCMLAATVSTSRAPGSLPLPAGFLHGDHVFSARIAATFAVVHAVVLLIEEPALLADLGPGSPRSILAGGVALTIMTLLATMPWRHSRRMHERPLAGAVHIALAVLAGGLTLVHLLAVDYGGVTWRRFAWSLLLAAAVITMIARRAGNRRRTAGGRTVHPTAPPVRPLARSAAVLSALIIAASLLVYAAAA